MYFGMALLYIPGEDFKNLSISSNKYGFLSDAFQICISQSFNSKIC